jgi:hypothetical protein
MNIYDGTKKKEWETLEIIDMDVNGDTNGGKTGGVVEGAESTGPTGEGS